MTFPPLRLGIDDLPECRERTCIRGWAQRGIPRPEGDSDSPRDHRWLSQVPFPRGFGSVRFPPSIISFMSHARLRRRPMDGCPPSLVVMEHVARLGWAPLCLPFLSLFLVRLVRLSVVCSAPPLLVARFPLVFFPHYHSCLLAFYLHFISVFAIV